jgi:hypothetical protein
MRNVQIMIMLCLTMGLAGAGKASEARPRSATQSPAIKNPATESPNHARAAGARWLIEHQAKDGGWGAGVWGQDVRDAKSDVATTSLAVLALMRDENGPTTHRQSIERGVLFVVGVVEASPLEGPRLQGPEGTQPQHKLGQNVDTHFAALMLGEVTPRLAGQARTRADIAYDKMLTKVISAQRADGSFDGNGWAPVLSSSVAAQSLYRAQEMGKEILPEALARSDDYQRRLVDSESGEFDASGGAGVDLYAAASSLRGNSNAAKRAEGEDKRRALDAARASADAVKRDRGALIAGFGSVGGEEMLSYMMISDSMAEQGGDDWKSWEGRIGDHLVAIQNADGSWSGHHCITSTTFVTAAAVMTLGSGDAIAARAQEPVASGAQNVATHR